ncbi:MAG: phospho-N-acetylmuramoyl-pentapeptide-transferase [Deltaproteobacteria bacterium]|nr:MAG: phospho-N-acetylmuramoyl-pentapeptide-transferase [Deltaproteobacteria bacterium]
MIRFMLMLLELAYYFQLEKIVYYLSYPFTRILVSFFFSLFLCAFFFPHYDRLIKKLQLRQFVREEGPKAHYVKNGTPTMGGGLLILVVVTSCCLWSDLRNSMLWRFLFVVISYGALGVYDDFKKVLYKNSDGLSVKWKFFWQILLSILIVRNLFYDNNFISVCSNYKIGTINFEMSFSFSALFAVFIIIVMSNAFNLSDGLDGLAIGNGIIVFSIIGLVAYIAGLASLDSIISETFNITPIFYGLEIATYCASLIGVGIVFLWHNTYPADIFLGDTGSLMFGALLGFFLIILKNEILFIAMNFFFLVELCSVLIQVLTFKICNGKRVFKMAPIHHHFEIQGMPEPKIVVRTWILTLLIFPLYLFIYSIFF